jgi:uncharacterized membrane protein YdjX (TVP38/TMEM64 family)
MPDAKNSISSENLLRFLKRKTSRSVLVYLAVGALLIVAVIAAGHNIEHNLEAIQTWLAGFGPWGIAAFVGLFVVTTSLLVPDTLLCIIAGALFGLYWGIAAVVAGNLLAAAVQFTLAHKLLRSPIQRMLARRPSLAAIERAVHRNAFRLQVLVRLTPLNPATISYLLGAAGVRFAGFIVASLASSPNLMIEVYFGYAGKHAAMLAGGEASAARLHDLAIIGGLVLSVAVMIFLSRIARNAVMQAVADTDQADSPPAQMV